MGNITLSRRVGIISQGGEEAIALHAYRANQKLNRCFLTIVIYREKGEGRIFIALDCLSKISDRKFFEY